METDEIPHAVERVGARMGHRVTVKKLERTDTDGRKVRTHPRYSWRCSCVENGRRATKYFKTKAAAMLVGADPEIRPAVALGLFVGLRMAELERLDWSEVHLDLGNVRVRASKAKSARNRLVPIPENLAAWLRQCPSRTGSVWSESHQGGRKLMEAARRAAGFGSAGEVRRLGAEAGKRLESGDEAPAEERTKLRKWPDNALRHSYATYHLAHHENAAALALHLGHSNIALTFAHYRLPVTKEETALYWTITPENAAEVARGSREG